MTYNLLGIEDLEAREGLAYVTGLEHLLTRHCDGCLLRLGVFGHLLEVYLFEIQDDVGHIFLNPGDGIKFVFHAVYLDCRNGIALKRREQYTTQCVADSDTIARLQRLELEFAVEVVSF